MSEAFTFDAGCDEVATAHVVYCLDVIDRVHRDGRLPTIRVDSRSWPLDLSLGFFDPTTRRIVVNLVAPLPELTIVHEIGHVLDHCALGGGPSVAAVLPELKGWRNAIRRTEAFRNLRRIYVDPAYDPTERVVERVPWLTLGSRSEEAKAKDVAHAEYLLDWAEIWARSYAQYIVATHRGDGGLSVLPHRLDEQRSSLYGQYFSPYWTDEEFEDVRIEVERLLQAKGWRTT